MLDFASTQFPAVSKNLFSLLSLVLKISANISVLVRKTGYTQMAIKLFKIGATAENFIKCEPVSKTQHSMLLSCLQASKMYNFAYHEFVWYIKIMKSSDILDV